MTEENTIIEDGNTENQEPEQAQPEKKKSNLIKYIIFAASGVAVAVIIAFGISMFFGGSDTTEQAEQSAATEEHQSEDAGHATINTENNQKAEATHEVAVQDEHKPADEMIDSEVESFDPAEVEAELPSDQFDEKAIDKIMANLDFLDYQPEESDIPKDAETVSVEDSVKEVNWLEEKKKELTQREKDVAKRESELAKLEKEINGKINRLDQAESSRIGKLAKLYDSMESRSVAKLMMNLDDNTVVSILPKMKNKNAAAVLQLLPSQRAARLSKQLITIADK